MKHGIFKILTVCIILVSCEGEHPVPKGFLQYGHPVYQNMSGSLLNKLNDEIIQGMFGDIHSLLIIRNDTIVFENYYSNYTRSDLHPIGASTQSIVSTLLGTMLLESETLRLDEKIINYFPEYSQYFNNIPQKDSIEIGHLLSNTSGLWWDEWSNPFGSEDNDAWVMSISDDWVGNVLSTPMIREPGFEFNFNSGNGILMGAVLEKLSGQNVEDYAKEKLFSPLNIHDWKWEKTPGGEINAAWGLHLRPMDLAKIGYLYLKDGAWNDQVLFEDTWVKRSSRARTSVSFYFNYGYFWWRFTRNADIVRLFNKNDVFFSWGDGGQFLFIIPHLNMVVVTTAGNYNNNETVSFDMLKDFIFASVIDGFP